MLSHSRDGQTQVFCSPVLTCYCSNETGQGFFLPSQKYSALRNYESLELSLPADVTYVCQLVGNVLETNNVS
jgi:hypothetical protein